MYCRHLAYLELRKHTQCLSYINIMKHLLVRFKVFLPFFQRFDLKLLICFVWFLMSVSITLVTLFLSILHTCNLELEILSVSFAYFWRCLCTAEA